MGDTYQEFSGNADVVVQARTIVGGVHVHIDRELAPLSTPAFVCWLLIAAIPLSGSLVLGGYGATHLNTGTGLAALGLAVLAGLPAVRIGAVMWEWWLLSREQQLDVLRRGLDRAVYELATTLGEQWRTEERIRRLQDPHPLPVRWVNAEGTASLPDLALA